MDSGPAVKDVKFWNLGIFQGIQQSWYSGPLCNYRDFDLAFVSVSALEVCSSALRKLYSYVEHFLVFYKSWQQKSNLSGSWEPKPSGYNVKCLETPNMG